MFQFIDIQPSYCESKETCCVEGELPLAPNVSQAKSTKLEPADYLCRLSDEAGTAQVDYLLARQGEGVLGTKQLVLWPSASAWTKNNG